MIQFVMKHKLFRIIVYTCVVHMPLISVVALPSFFFRLRNSLSHFSRLFLHREEKTDEVIDTSEDEKETKYFGGNFTAVDCHGISLI